MRNSIRGTYNELIKKYQIPLTGFYWRKKQAGDDYDKLIELLEDYKKKKEVREKRKADPSKRSPYKESTYIIKTPDHLMSRDEYYLFLHEHIKKSVYMIRRKYTTVQQNRLLDNEDIVDDIFIQCLRPSRDRQKRVSLSVYDEFKYEIGMVLPICNEDDKVEIIKLNKKGIPEAVKEVDPATPLTEVFVEAEEGQEIYPAIIRADLYDKNNEPIMINSTTLYEKYVKNPAMLATIRSFINFITHNYFKDNIANIKNTTPKVSLYQPIENSNGMVLADLFSTEDEDMTSIKEFLERCDTIVMKGVPLGNVIRKVMEGETMAVACRMYNLQTRKVRDELEKAGVKEILGGHEA